MKTSFASPLKLAAVIIFICSLSACGPVYDTRYSFVPPQNSSGRVCVGSCDSARYHCTRAEQLRLSQCEDLASREAELCSLSHDLTGEKEHWYDCVPDSCSSNWELCQQQYRACYQSCGGEVKAATVCVMNCEGARS